MLTDYNVGVLWQDVLRRFHEMRAAHRLVVEETERVGLRAVAWNERL